MKRNDLKTYLGFQKCPHFGVAGEIFVKETKPALYIILKEKAKGLMYPSEKIFQALLFEIPNLLNRIPLT